METSKCEVCNTEFSSKNPRKRYENEETKNLSYL